MRLLFLLFLLIAASEASAKINYPLNCLKEKYPAQHCQRIQKNLILWKDDIKDVAIKEKVPVALFTAIIAIESHFNAHSHSKFGPMGLTQIQPKTAKSVGYTQEMIKDPIKNLHAGATYLRTLLDKYETMDLVIIAYKTGGKVSQTKLPPAVKNYLQQVLELYAYFLLKETE